MTDVYDAGQGVLVTTSNSTGVVEGVDARAGEVLWTLDTGSRQGMLHVARGQPANVWQPPRLAVVFGTDMACYVATTDDPWRQPGPPGQIPGLVGCWQALWAGSVLVVSNSGTTVGLADGDPARQLWTVPQGVKTWVGTKAFSTSSGVFMTADGSPAPYGKDVDASASPFFTELGGRVVRWVATPRSTEPCGSMSIQGWDTKTDRASWASPLDSVDVMAVAWDASRHDYVLLVVGPVTATTLADGGGTSCGVELGQAILTAYSLADGGQLWSVPLPDVQGQPSFTTTQWMPAHDGRVTDTAAGAVALSFFTDDMIQTSNPGMQTQRATTLAIDLRTRAVKLSVDGVAVTGDAAGALFVVSSDLSTITAYDLNTPDARQLFQVPLPRRSSAPAADPALVAFDVGDYVVAITDAGMMILR